MTRTLSYAPRRGRPQCEAFPSLDMLAVVRHEVAGSATCEWTNENGQVIGYAHLNGLTDTKVEMAFRFFGTPNVEQIDATTTFEIECKRINSNVERKYFLCPACRRTKRTVFLVKSAWACRECHCLVFISQRLSAVNKKAALLFSEPISPATISKANIADGLSSGLPDELRHRSNARWLDVGDLPSIPSSTKAAKSGWSIGDGGGLDTYRPEPPPPTRADAVGTPVLHRPLPTVLRAWVRQQAEPILQAFMGRGKVAVADLVKMLESAIRLDPLEIAPGWLSVTPGQSDDGFAELNSTTGWKGTAGLWLAVSTAKAPSPLRLILDDDTLTLKLRAQSLGSADLTAALEATRAELDRRVEGLRVACARFNEERRERARKYLTWHWPREQRAFRTVARLRLPE